MNASSSVLKSKRTIQLVGNSICNGTEVHIMGDLHIYGGPTTSEQYTQGLEQHMLPSFSNTLQDSHWLTVPTHRCVCNECERALPQLTADFTNLYSTNTQLWPCSCRESNRINRETANGKHCWHHGTWPVRAQRGFGADAASQKR